MSDLESNFGEWLQEAEEHKAEENELHEQIADRLGIEDDEPEEEQQEPEDSWAASAEIEEPEHTEPQYDSTVQINAAYQQLQAEAAEFHQQVNAIDWNRLRQEDPANYANLRQHAQAWQQNIAVKEQHLRQSAQGLQEKHLASEKEKVLKAIPEWKDENVAALEKKEVWEFLKSKGYSDQDIQAVSARDVINARKWWLSERKVSEVQSQKKLKPLKRKKPRINSKDLHPAKAKLMRENGKRYPGGRDDIALRLIEGGYL